MSMQVRKGDLGQDLFVTKQTARKSQLEIQDRVNKKKFFSFLTIGLTTSGVDTDLETE